VNLKGTTHELFILATSILSIVNLVLEVAIPDQAQSWWLIVYIDVALTLIFLADFTCRLTTGDPKETLSTATSVLRSRISSARKISSSWRPPRSGCAWPRSSLSRETDRRRREPPHGILPEGHACGCTLRDLAEQHPLRAFEVRDRVCSVGEQRRDFSRGQPVREVLE
jgi:hypothetical protein